MRNPKNSWNKSDSYFGLIDINEDEPDYNIANKWVNYSHPELKFSDKGYDIWGKYDRKLADNGVLKINNHTADVAYIGPNDMKLAQTLIKAGPEHRKFLRQIFVSVDITAPLYWWGEMDTYKVATVANSTSKMHKLADTQITLDCFETDDMNPDLVYYEIPMYASLIDDIPQNDIGMFSDLIVEQLEMLRQKYIETKDKRYWKELIRWLPEGWLQKRTWTANYETIRSICSVSQRRNHKLNEWSGKDDPTQPNFIAWARTLPYAQYFLFDDEEIPFTIEK